MPQPNAYCCSSGTALQGGYLRAASVRPAGIGIDLVADLPAGLVLVPGLLLLGSLLITG